jgi:hypothetical protein
MRRAGWREGAVVLRVALPLAAGLLLATSGASAQQLSWTGAASYSRGSYVFDATTHSVYLSTGLQMTMGRLDLSGSIPLVLQNSGLVTVVGGTTLPTGGPDAGTVGKRQPGETIGTGRGSGPGGGGGTSVDSVTYRNEFTSEIGDPFFSTALRVYEGDGILRSLQARVSTKAPLRDVDSGVGTGEWDFGAGGTAFAALGGTFVFADVAYWWYGDMPELELADGLTYGIGVSRAFHEGRASVMASFLGASATIETMESPASLGLGIGYVPRPGRSFSAGVALGLSESSPDLSVYAGWSLGIN